MSAQSRRPDVIVVGGGPAGATAALELASNGLRVQLLDRARFPRNKPCGGAISMRALSRFPWLEPALPRISTLRLSRLHLEAPSGDGLTLTSPRPAALMVRRVEFDAMLMSLAREAGAEVLEGVEITRAHEMDRTVVLRTRDGREFEAPYVIAADGVNSTVARRLRLNNGWPPSRVAIDMMEETPHETLRSVDPHTMWVAYGYGGSEGYAYVFPKATHVNVGIGYVLDYFRAHVEQSPWELQQEFTGGLSRRDVLSGRSSRRHFTPFMIPVGGPLKRTATDRVLLAGDAGGFVNGITAEGIYYAMVTGELAGRAIVTGDVRHYERSWKQEIGAELRDAVLVQRHLLTTPARVDHLVTAARKAPAIADLIVRYAMGEVSYRTARRRVVMHSPLFGIRLLLNAIRPARQAAPLTEALTTEPESRSEVVGA
jgi:geranylgeranyl reductase family protein